jgi:hypothetical protein
VPNNGWRSDRHNRAAGCQRRPVNNRFSRKPPIPHIHPIDEWFYGEMTVELGNQTIIGRAGDSLWIPRGTVHRFKVTSPVCRALNGYTPAGFEQVIIGLAKPAERRELPPLMDPPDQITIDKVFNNYWCAEARDGWALSRLGIR